jgi:microcystin-dependent protein
MEGTIGEIRMFAGNFAPKNWSFCNGSLQSIAQNTALFSILGTTFGGDGRTTFGLPDFRGRVAVGTGQGPGLSSVVLGELAGSQTNTLIVSNLPSHTHTATGTVTPGASLGGRGANTSNIPTNNYPLETASGNNIYANPSNTNMGQSPVTVTVNNTGNNIPVNNMQPYLGMNYIICLFGIFPSRN